MRATACRRPIRAVATILTLVGWMTTFSAPGAPTYLLPDASSPSLSSSAAGGGPAPARARTHILVELSPGTDEPRFVEHARAQGLRKLGRVYGTRWLTMAIPANASPDAAAAAARGLPGVSRATPDLIVRTHHHLPPANPPYVNDPLYIYDDDPSTKPDCDPCTAAEIVDQWGLFRVDAEGGWDVETGGATSNGDEIVIAILDSGMDLDHDDLKDNLWTNPGEVPDGLDNDGNGFVDDLHGADFVGASVGNPFTDDPSSEDSDPDIPATGNWVEDLSAPWWWRFDGDPAVGDALDNNGDFLIDPGVFHGTFVAGIAAAATNNVNPETQTYEGIAGSCWSCKLMAVRMIDAEGGGLISDAAAAIRYATDHGADIINASWGVPTDGLNPADVEIARQAVNYAVAHGVIFVAAAGNAGTTNMSFPASMANVIAVGSSDWLDGRSLFSSYASPSEIPDDGIDNDGNGWIDDVVDIVAPGELIWSSTVVSAYEAFILNGWDWFCCAATPGPNDWYPGEDAYTRSDGTSFSTPLVSGHIGVILSANCGAGLAEVRAALRSNALDVGLPGYDPQTGFGRLQFVVPTGLGSGTCGGGGGGGGQPPVADAGPDQEVIDHGRSGENVTLDGSASFDPDGGAIASYAWIASSGNVIGVGPTVVVSLSQGSHDITLRVVDDEGDIGIDTLTVDVCKKSCSSGDGGSGGGDPGAGTAIYMADVTFQYKGRALNVTITVRRDSNDNGIAEDSDPGVGETVVQGQLCQVATGICYFEGTPIQTGGNGQASYKLFGAVGQYTYGWSSVQHPEYTWDPGLDAAQPVIGP